VRVISFEIAGVESGNKTYRHRILDSSPISVHSFEEYSRRLRESLVEFDPERRRERLKSEIQALLEDTTLKVIEDRDLEKWIVNSTEWPHAVPGSFHERFLKLPREILITVMRDHQKYFALEDDAGNLQPKFIASLNLDSDPKGYIQSGHERVLAARFADAEFFWNADQRIPLADRLPMLEKVTYQAKLGSYGNKIRRMQVISDEVTSASVFPPESGGHLRRAITLSKCDLTTQMVQEFPELQGVVGGLYAHAQGEPDEVWRAVYEHYLPQGLEDDCPKTSTGAFLSFVDKFDAVLAGFAAGLEPRGSNDPFGLRRHASGAIKLLLEFEVPINLRELTYKAYSRLQMGSWRPGNEVYDPLIFFLGDRLQYYLETAAGIRFDTVRAVMAVGFDVPLQALHRAQALESIRSSEDFLAVCVAVKRIRNILAKSATDSDWQPGEPRQEWLQEEVERDLYQEYHRIKQFPLRSEDPARYKEFLRMIASLRPTVDLFFDKVLVMDDDPNLRQNRLRLLAGLKHRFSEFADLSQIESTASSLVDAPTSKGSGK
jgi:glycyl-tRNA synthetase beta chain